MEGRVFVCTWKKTGSGYRVWVKRRPTLAAEQCLRTPEVPTPAEIEQGLAELTGG